MLPRGGGAFSPVGWAGCARWAESQTQSTETRNMHITGAVQSIWPVLTVSCDTALERGWAGVKTQNAPRSRDSTPQVTRTYRES